MVETYNVKMHPNYIEFANPIVEKDQNGKSHTVGIKDKISLNRNQISSIIEDENNGKYTIKMANGDSFTRNYIIIS